MDLNGCNSREQARKQLYGAGTGGLQLLAYLAKQAGLEEDAAVLLGTAEALAEVAGPCSLNLQPPAEAQQTAH